ncbi:hypothetical protein FHX75_121448 [Micromonospora palomenae]|uniref:Uncharacterized protein n=1 Tax=Micromonospora palomenae TaxID=1461247 RepID=A0A561WGA2_9ACTN|nr:hypothetical protein FHX75_121448 [Micromonospora palomenae]
MAAVASLAAVAVLVTLLVRHPANILTVGLALLCVLLATVAGTAVAALREQPSTGATPPGPPDAGPPVLDADTLDALDSAAVRAKLEELDDLRDR